MKLERRNYSKLLHVANVYSTNIDIWLKFWFILIGYPT